MNNTATSDRSISVTILLTVLMIFLGISAATGGLNRAETTDLSDQNDVLNTILPLSQLNEPGFQEGSIFTDTTLSSGYYHTCAILDNGDLKCWGRDSNGQLGNGGSNTNLNAPSSTAINLGTGRTAVAVSTGAYHTCAILDNGDLKCWGWGARGQLGHGATTSLNSPPSTAINLGTGRTAVAVTAGADHTCAILDNGDLKCWGSDSNGQLGDGGSNANRNSPPSAPINLGTGRTAIAVSATDDTTCAILDNGDLKCWGNNNKG